jgi:hypothetical protein
MIMIGKEVEVYTPIRLHSTGNIEYIKATGTVVDEFGRGIKKRFVVIRRFIGCRLVVKPEEIKRIIKE